MPDNKKFILQNRLIKVIMHKSKYNNKYGKAVMIANTTKINVIVNYAKVNIIIVWKTIKREKY